MKSRAKVGKGKLEIRNDLNIYFGGGGADGSTLYRETPMKARYA